MPALPSSCFFVSRRLLIKADDISCRITKSRGYLRCVHTDRLHNRASVSNDGVDGCGYAVNHDVDQEAGLRRRSAAEHPCSAHLAHRVVKGGTAVAALPDLPSENLFVKRC